jgi:hypothetical protein
MSGRCALTTGLSFISKILRRDIVVLILAEEKVKHRSCPRCAQAG